MSAEPSPRGSEGDNQQAGRGLPVGVILLGMLLATGAAVMAFAALVVPDSSLAGVPRRLLLWYGFVLMILATGVFRRRRWAWFATLAFVVVNAYYLLAGVATYGQNRPLGLGTLAAIAAYLLSPRARATFLNR